MAPLRYVSATIKFIRRLKSSCITALLLLASMGGVTFAWDATQVFEPASITTDHGSGMYTWAHWAGDRWEICHVLIHRVVRMVGILF